MAGPAHPRRLPLPLFTEGGLGDHPGRHGHQCHRGGHPMAPLGIRSPLPRTLAAPGPFPLSSWRCCFLSLAWPPLPPPFPRYPVATVILAPPDHDLKDHRRLLHLLRASAQPGPLYIIAIAPSTPTVAATTRHRFTPPRLAQASPSSSPTSSSWPTAST